MTFLRLSKLLSVSPVPTSISSRALKIAAKKKRFSLQDVSKAKVVAVVVVGSFLGNVIYGFVNPNYAQFMIDKGSIFTPLVEVIFGKNTLEVKRVSSNESVAELKKAAMQDIANKDRTNPASTSKVKNE